MVDASGASVPGATVRITEAQTGDSRSAVTNETGVYTISTVSSGSYRVSIRKEGFKDFEAENITVRQGETVRLNGQLEVGAASEKVEVTADTAVLQSDRADVHSQIGSTDILNLPQPTRTYQGLFEMLPGMSPPGGILLGGNNNPSRTMTFSGNGAAANAAEVRVEGVSARNAWGGSATSSFAPSVEAIQSVNVVTGTPDAEQGIGTVAVQVQLKSGTNATHGAAYLYNIDSKFEARNFFSTASTPNHLVDNDTGGFVGGHIIKDKLFYFASYEGDYTRQGVLLNFSMPVPAMLAGDFSGAPSPIYEPNTGASNGTRKTPFPGNQIPRSMFAPQLSQILPLVPPPNLPGTLNNYTENFASLYNLHKIDTKVDYIASTKLRASARWGYQPYYNSQVPPLGLTLGGGTLGVASTLSNSIDPLLHGATLAESAAATYVVSPSFVIDITAGLTQMHETEVPIHTGVKYGTGVLGIPGTNEGALPWSEGEPEFTITNYGQLFGASYPLLLYKDPVYELNANATKTKGKHNIRFGTDIIKIDLNHNESNPTSFTFSGGVTALNGGPSPNQWNAMADFLLGYPTTMQNSVQNTLPSPQTQRTWLFNTYVKDQWQISRKVTLNYGLRWEYYPVPQQANKGVTFYNFNTGLVEECGVGGISSNCGIHVSKREFAPSVGIAYRVQEKTVIRAGFAIAPLQYQMARNEISSFPDSIINSYTSANSYVPVSSLAMGIPPIIPPTVVNGIIVVPPGTGNLDTDPMNFKRGYTESWNLTLQREFRGGIVGSVGYVGSHNVNLFAIENINYGQVGGGTASEPFFSKGITGSVSEFAPVGNSHYESLQSTFTKRFQNGFTAQGAFTYSHEIGLCCGGEQAAPSILIPQYQALNVATMPNDRTLNFHLSSVYELPFGKNKPLLQHGPLAAIAGGWSLNGIFSTMSGLPFSVSASSASCNCPGSTQRANQILPNVALTGSGLNGTSYFNPLAFSPVTTAAFGNVGFDTLRGPGRTNLDMSLFRTLNLTERFKLQLRAEAMNISNTPHFGNPGANVSNLVLNPDGSVKNLNGFGQITSTTAVARVIDQRYFRFGFRIVF